MAANEGDEDDPGPSLLPSVDDALDGAGDDFLRAGDQHRSLHGSVLTEEPKRAREPPLEERDAPTSKQAKTGQPARPPEPPERKKETTREKNKRKEKVGQATFSLKWDRDCGAERAGL